MKPGSVRSSIAFGLSAAIVSVSLAGCAGAPVINRPMYTQDLNAFQIDCSRRDEQIQMLLNQLASRDDRLLSWWTNYLKPWEEYTGEPDYQLRREIAGRQTNWQIQQNLYHIRKFCG